LKIAILISLERGRRCLESLYACVSNKDEIIESIGDTLE
jgi:hypothetical protein